MPDPSQQILRAAGGGLLGVFTVVALTYVLWGIITEESLLYAGAMIDTLSMGDGFNSLLGVWALSFSPLTSLNDLYPNWMDIWYYILIPIIIAGLVMALITKRISTSILGGVFFIFWGITLPILFVYVLPVFGIGDPPLINSILYGILNETIENWLYGGLFDLTGENLFLSWIIAGTIEYSIIVILVSLPFSAIIQIISK